MFYNLLLTLQLSDLLDITLVAVLCYHLLLLLSGTRAANLLKGLGLLLLVRIVAAHFAFYSVAWIIEAGMTVGLIAIIVIFQPELRAGLERIGRGGVFVEPLEREAIVSIVREISESLARMARSRTGALIVFERRTGLREFIETGVALDSSVTAELLITVFKVGTPLHDGAVIIRGERLAAASCFLPLSQNPDLPKETGSRHRAAIGVTEVTDCVAITVSEETGAVSWVEGGKMTRGLSTDEFKRRLEAVLTGRRGESLTLLEAAKRVTTHG